ncbi:PepSY-associated TM helix domain-containing protein [Pseudonocardia spinosispora]|uniref:PepSY-associated TM helix domain-containing protein n=1 Tax=Pseudonocardia spinosispora TaxID=103441 RepID=UPI00041361E2|nr:PepSY-associated TM helix domain-containing protein [Pseudonocardia spinosispora]
MSDITVSRPDVRDDDHLSLTAAPPAGRGRAANFWWRELRPLVLRLHFYAGLFLGPFLLIAATTGLLYTLTPQLERYVHQDQLRVTVPHGAQPLPLSQQIETAIAAVPGGTVIEVRPPVSAEGTTRVVFDAPGVPADYSRTAFIDPYTARSTGVLTTFGEWLPVRAWFDELHRTLHLGAVGRLYTELAASWLWVLTLSGLGIWLARRRRQNRVRRTLAPELRATGRVRLRSWHASVGVWATVGLLFLSATGLTWSQFAGTNVDTLRSAMSWTTPTVHTALPSLPPTTGSPAELAINAERALAVARAHGLSDPVEITPPTKPGRAWVVMQNKRSWPEKQDSVSVDPVNGTVVDQLAFADWPLAAKLARWGVDAHMGLLFGLASQIALAALALAVICMVVWGYRMWWLRRPTRDDSPGATRAPSFSAVVLLAALAVAIGLFLPVFGGSVLLFLLLDAVRGRRSRTPADARD